MGTIESGSGTNPKSLETQAKSAEEIRGPENATWKRIKVVSNRLPFKVVNGADGKPSILATSGGLVTAMSPLLRDGVGGEWIGWPGTAEEEGLEEALARTKPNGLYEVGVVSLTPEEVKQYYEGYSNEVLAPLFGGEYQRIDAEQANRDWPVYKQVQKKFADKICEDLDSGDIVWVQDYHLLGVGKELHKRSVKQPTGFFLHMPFPTKEELSVLPQREEILRDLLHYDLVGFQTERFKQHFVYALQKYVPEAEILRSRRSITPVRFQNRIIRLGTFPISIDTEEFKTQRAAHDTQKNVGRLGEALHNMNDAQLMFNAGRLDYMKGFYEELKAFDRLLEKHPELIGDLILYQLVIPGGRDSLPDYAEYREKIQDLAREINNKYKKYIIVSEDDVRGAGSGSYPGRPVRQMHRGWKRHDFIAHLASADIQSYPTLADGMHLVSKEGAIVGKTSAVMMLGKDAGSAEELGQYAILIDPKDTEAYSNAMYQAYTMAEEERRHRKSGMRRRVMRYDIFDWWSKEQGPAFQAIWNEKLAAAKESAEKNQA